MISLDCESSTLSFMDSALNPPKITLCGAPILAQASIEITNSGTIGKYIVTLSPFFTPKLFNALAHLVIHSKTIWHQERSILVLDPILETNPILWRTLPKNFLGLP